jgi:hypothetical protein
MNIFCVLLVAKVDDMSKTWAVNPKHGTLLCNIFEYFKSEQGLYYVCVF